MSEDSCSVFWWNLAVFRPIIRISNYSLILIVLCLLGSRLVAEEAASPSDEETREALLKTPMPDWPNQPLSDKEREKAVELFTKMAKASEEIKSGIVHGKQTLWLLPSKQQRSHDWTLVYDNQGRKRFKNLIRVGNVAQGWTYHYLFDGREQWTWIDIPGRLRPRPLIRRPPGLKKVIDNALPPNIESIGFGGKTIFRQKRFDIRAFKRLILERCPPQFVGIHKTSKGRSLLLKAYEPARRKDNEERRYRAAYWNDPEKGGRLHKAAEWQQNAPNEKWTLINVWTVDWVQQGGVFVPKHFRGLSNQNGVDDFKLNLKWDSVNKPIPESEFTWKAFHPPAGTQIVNYKTGQAVIESRVGEEKSRD